MMLYTKLHVASCESESHKVNIVFALCNVRMHAIPSQLATSNYVVNACATTKTVA